jgi:hypothetical protein
MFAEKTEFPVRLQESSRLYPITSPRALEELSNIPLDPWEYCSRYVPKKTSIQIGEWGYWKACVRELSRVTGLGCSTVNSWGNHFQRAPRLTRLVLRQADMLMQIQEKLKNTKSDSFLVE